MSAEVRRRQRVDRNSLLCAAKPPNLPVRLDASERVSMVQQLGPYLKPCFIPSLRPPYQTSDRVDDGDGIAAPATIEFESWHTLAFGNELGQGSSQPE
jgi:hypothetical protein